MIKSFHDLIVWQKSMDLVSNIYDLGKLMPKTEIYGLTQQFQRAAVSIPSNIAEGRNRRTRKDFSHFLRMALGSAGELQTQLLLIKRTNLIESDKLEGSLQLLEEILKMLNSMLAKLEANT